MEIRNILKGRRIQLGLTQLDVAKAVGVSEATVSRWESGDIANMKRSRIAALANVLKISPAVIMGWKDSPSTPIDTDELFNLIDAYKKDFERINDKPNRPSNIIPMPEMRRAPLIGTIACGTPVLAQENLDGEVDIPAEIHADFALRCKGDSMINARIYDGDIVYIRQQEEVEHGEIAAVLIDDAATLKRVYLYDDHISLEAENPQYRPMVYWGDDMNNVKIIGKAVAFTGAVK